PTLEAHALFAAEPTLYAVAIVDPGGRPVGLLNRFKFLEELSRPYARDLSAHQTVAASMDKSPLIVDEHMSIDHLNDILVDEDNRYIFDGFIVTRQGKYLGIGTGLGLMRRLTERKHAELFQLAHHDSLTGLANRELFNDRLTQAMARAKRTGHRLGILYIDVD